MAPRAFSGDSTSIPLTADEYESALKVQKAFLGFLVRKSFRKIIDLSRRVEEIHRRICQEEGFDLIMNNEMERMKVNEALMTLILELDSLAVYSGVRCCRKAVIKKAIALQEAVDAIGTIDSAEDLPDAVRQSPTVAVNEPSNCTGDFVIIENEAEAPVEASVSSSKSHASSNSAASSGELEQIVKIDAKSYKLMHKNMTDQELLEKLMDENKKLMNMMQEVFEMNQMQAQSINSLTSRVEQLERAKMDDNLRKIRKRRHAIDIMSTKH